MLIGILVVMLINTDEVNAYCYVEYNVSWHTMNDNDDRSEATIIHHGVRQHDHDVTSRRRVCSSDDEPKVSLSLLLIEEE